MAARIRVLYVIDSLAPGGAETSLASVAPALTALGVELHVAYFHERPGVAGALIEAGSTLHHIESSRAGRIRRIRRMISTLQPALVHTTLYEADQVGRVAGWSSRVPVLTSLVSTGFELGPAGTALGVRKRAALAVDMATARLVDRFHAVSEPVADTMSTRLRVPRDRFTVIPRGRDSDVLGRRSDERRRRVRSSLGIDEDTPVVLAVGREVAPKQHAILIESVPAIAHRHPDVQVLFAGHRGPVSDSLDRRIGQLGIEGHVRRLGHREDVADLLAASDVLAFPSSREGFPGTLVEALALECPIVASDIPAIRAVVSDGSVVADLVAVGDSSALALAITSVLSDGRSGDVTLAGRARFEERFTTPAVAQRMHHLYVSTADADR